MRGDFLEKQVCCTTWVDNITKWKDEGRGDGEVGSTLDTKEKWADGWESEVGALPLPSIDFEHPSVQTHSHFFDQ